MLAKNFGLFGIPLNNVHMHEALREIDCALDGSSVRHFSFINAHYANVACADEEYRKALSAADAVYIDGIGMRIAARIKGVRLVDNVNGTDMFPLLCEQLARTGHSVFLLGGRDGVAATVVDWMQKNYPRIRIAGHRHGYFHDGREAEVVSEIAATNPELLLIGFGAPHQDLWVRRHLHDLGCKVAMCVGGLFDVYSGNLSRPPRLLRQLGFEWIYRLWQEPVRLFRRYVLGNPLFLARVVAERVRSLHQR